MVSRTTVTVHDDIDNSEGASTIPFAYKGTSYEIDLGEKNQAALDKALSKYLGVARKVSRSGAAPTRRGSGAAAGRRSDLAEIRAWARENGLDVSERGRISGEVQQAYDAAH